MDNFSVKEIDAKRFKALAAQARSPAAAYTSEELAWYANADETVIGVILLDTIDDDYAAIVLGRDEGGRFRAFDLEVSIQTMDEAVDWMIGTIMWYTSTGKKVFPQGDIRKGIDLFSPIVPIEKQHPCFITLDSDSAFIPAKTIINHMMPYFIDIDGNFVEQFQSAGFDSRLWELYLNAYLTEEQLFINREHNAPDFIVKKYGKSVAIEAVIVGRRENNPPKFFKNYNTPRIPLNLIEEHENAMPIKFGSPLYSNNKSPARNTGAVSKNRRHKGKSWT
ncbi:MAG: hypothetical protein ACREOH_06970 [Candidatus Entotheonellia bacterium]